MTHDLDGTTIFLLNCCQDASRGGRIDWGLTESDLLDWNQFLTPFGHGEDTWLTAEEVAELLPQEEI